jgi:hypothetical protein
MSERAGPASVHPDPEHPGQVDLGDFAAAFDRQAARVVDYCYALVGDEDVAVAAAQAALDSAWSRLRDPDRLRAFLFALARREALATDSGAAHWSRARADPGREVLELVYRYGIHPEDLGAVLGLPADEAAAVLAAAELELGRPAPMAEPGAAGQPPEHLDLAGFAEAFQLQAGSILDYCRTLVGETVAASATEAALLSAETMLGEPIRLRAWLFALARQQVLAFEAAGPADASGTRLLDDPGREVLELIDRFGLDPDVLPSVVGVPAGDVQQLLAAAEVESDRWEAPADDDAADEAADGGPIRDAQHRRGAGAGQRSSAGWGTAGRRRVLAALATVPAMGLIGVGIYLVGPSHAASAPSSSARPGGANSRPSPTRLTVPPAVSATTTPSPHASSSPQTVPAVIPSTKKPTTSPRPSSSPKKSPAPTSSPSTPSPSPTSPSPTSPAPTSPAPTPSAT